MSTEALLTLAASDIAIPPNGRATLSARVVHRGTQPEQYRLAVRGLDSAWVRFQPPTLTLAPATHGEITIELTAPAGAPTDAALTVELVAASGAVRATAPLHLRVAGVAPAGQPRPAAAATGPAARRPRWLLPASVLALAAALALAVHARAAAIPTAAIHGPAVCADPSAQQVFLSSDNQVTAIMYSTGNPNRARILRTEPATVLPGNFDALLALSGDGARVAYVTADDLMLDNATIWWIDVANPAQRNKLVDVPVGLWVVQPVWSPDKQHLAFLKLNSDKAVQGRTQLELWVANVDGGATKVAALPEGQVDSFYGSRRASLCWAADNRTLVIENAVAAGAALQTSTTGATTSAAFSARAASATPAASGPAAAPFGAPAPLAPATPTPIPAHAPSGAPTNSQAASPTAGARPTGTPTPTPREEQIQIDIKTGATTTPMPQPAQPTPLPGVDRTLLRTDGTPCGVPILSQNDPRWRTAIMQAGGDSIGSYGCALTSTAMLLNYFGQTISPAQLSACLGSAADLLQWWDVDRCTAGHAHFVDEPDFSWPALDAILAAGSPAIVGFRGGPAGMHFVVVTAGRGGGDGSNYAVTDPWDASTDKTMRYFITRGYTPTWIVHFAGDQQACTSRLVTDPSTVDTSPVPPPAPPRAQPGQPAPSPTRTPLPTPVPPPLATMAPAPGHVAETWRTPNATPGSPSPVPTAATTSPPTPTAAPAQATPSASQPTPAVAAPRREAPTPASAGRTSVPPTVAPSAPAITAPRPAPTAAAGPKQATPGSRAGG